MRHLRRATLRCPCSLLGRRLCTSAAPAGAPPPPRVALTAPGASASTGVGPLRSPPRWDRTGLELLDPAALYGSALRYEEGKTLRVSEFGTTKQWKTLSSREALESYSLRLRDLDGLPFVAKYNVFEQHATPRLTRFYVVFDVQDRALARWGTADEMRAEQARRRSTRERRIARLQPPVMMLLRPVRARKGVVVVGARAVTAAIVGNTVVVVAKLAGWGWTGSAAMLSEAFHSLADLGSRGTAH